MLGTFPKDFSQVAASQGYFPSGNFPNVQFTKRQLPKCAIHQAATSLICTSRSARPPAWSSCGAWPPSSS